MLKCRGSGGINCEMKLENKMGKRTGFFGMKRLESGAEA